MSALARVKEVKAEEPKKAVVSSNGSKLEKEKGTTSEPKEVPNKEPSKVGLKGQPPIIDGEFFQFVKRVKMEMQRRRAITVLDRSAGIDSHPDC
ncbi:hypothetical protein HHK36_022231 [Tetracentron sinense]|uniref:Uncharacterized protein n=1 Tax=Tetracentron sinense TaxID=13715 RepID=A0A835D6K5_TETSI|nr:hypothetical protein HHK36_022231 [Tetracentron sinense]